MNKETHKYAESEPIFSDEELEQDFSEEQLNDKGSKISESVLYTLFVKSAYRLLQKPLAVFRILKKAVARLQKYDSIREFAKDAKEQIETITRMIGAYVKGDYRGISKTNAALSLAAILYFLSPIDFIPDFLAVGLLDDLAILTWVYTNFQQEIEGFLTWEEETKLIRIEIDPVED